jgi:D-tagatose-1,6-bisphosphate aldolase subunit GatZ/KbaZ
MNQRLRAQAATQNLSLMEYLLRKIEALRNETGVPRTILAACPNSAAVITASLRAAKRNNAPIKFAATLNQVDLDGGYTGLTQKQFVQTIRQEAKAIHFTGPVIVAIDHGGPWLKDLHNKERWTYEDSMNAVKKSFEAAVEAGYDLIHVDPTVDITLPKGETISIDVVAERTVELISSTEKFRRAANFPKIAYEVGTEEVHGGLADMKVFKRFLNLLKEGLERQKLSDAWPCFIVGKVGTDLHTSTFDPNVARELAEAASEFGSVIKGHYSDNVTNPGEYPESGMGGANVGPEFTECEYDALVELCDLEAALLTKGDVTKSSALKSILWNAVIASQRWKKWLHEGESPDDFYLHPVARQTWFIRTGCRYIWENPEVLAARNRLYRNLELNNVKAEEIVLSSIEKAMDKYFHKFNLVDLNQIIVEEEMNVV